MVIPVGERYQQTMYLLKKVDGKLEQEALRPTLFVPMTGKAETQRELQARPGESENSQRRLRGDHRRSARAARLALCAAVQIRRERIRARGQAVHQVFQRRRRPQQPGAARFRRRWAESQISRRHLSASPARISITRRFRTPSRSDYYQPALVFIFYDENRGPLGERSARPLARHVRLAKRNPPHRSPRRKPAKPSSASACSARPAKSASTAWK